MQSIATIVSTVVFFDVDLDVDVDVDTGHDSHAHARARARASDFVVTTSSYTSTVQTTVACTY